MGQFYCKNENSGDVEWKFFGKNNGTCNCSHGVSFRFFNFKK